MKRFFVCVMMICLIIGCATSEQSRLAREKAIADAANIPKCKDDAECKRFMSAAYAWISKNSGMKVQISNDNSIETYNPTPYQWGYKVIKTPTQDGGYQLDFDAKCNCGIFGDPVFKKADFNNYVWQMNPPTNPK